MRTILRNLAFNLIETLTKIRTYLDFLNFSGKKLWRNDNYIQTNSTHNSFRNKFAKIKKNAQIEATLVIKHRAININPRLTHIEAISSKPGVQTVAQLLFAIIER